MTAPGPDALDLVGRRVINVLGHELPTPLRTVRGLAERVPRASDTELPETLIPALLRNARRAEHLLDELLIAGDIASAVPTAPARAVDLAALAEAVASETPDLELSTELSCRGGSAVTPAAGLGVGLPVARGLARLEGGDLTIEHNDRVLETRLNLRRAS